MENNGLDTAKTIMDGLSVVTVIGALAEVLPSIATLLTIIWFAIRIWETDTVRGWFNKVPLEGDKNA
jgi:hypothetical protein